MVVVDALNVSPCECAALGRSKILHCMEAERGEVGYASHHLAMPAGTESVCGISHDGHSTNRFLNISLRREECFLAVCDVEYAVVVARNTSQINRNNSFCLLVDCVSQFVIVHLKRVFLSVDQYQFCSYVADYACRCRVSIGGSDYFIVRTNTQHPQRHL